LLRSIIATEENTAAQQQHPYPHRLAISVLPHGIGFGADRFGQELAKPPAEYAGPEPTV